MSRSKGKPSGINKSEGTGMPSDFKPEDLNTDKEVTRKYTDDDKKPAEKVRITHPNRNVDKGDATNAGGYKN
jgi:hypothetical protein